MMRPSSARRALDQLLERPEFPDVEFEQRLRVSVRTKLADELRDLEPQTTLDDLVNVVLPLVSAANDVVVTWDLRHEGVWQPDVRRRAEVFSAVLKQWVPNE